MFKPAIRNTTHKNKRTYFIHSQTDTQKATGFSRPSPFVEIYLKL